MRKHVAWTGSASRDVEELWNYLAPDNPREARQQVGRIEKVTTQLARFSGLGRPGRCAGTRELVIGRTPYVVMYRVREQTVEILRVLHGNRRWPDVF